MKNIVLSVLIIICFSHFMVKGQNLSARDIMEKYYEIIENDDQKVEMNMALIRKNGKKQERSLLWFTKMDKEKNQSAFVRFLTPADIKGSSFLSIEYTDRDEDQWLYLPALKRTRRINPGEQTDNFMGSDFTFEDLGIDTDDLNDFDWEIIGEEVVDGNNCFIIQGIPNNDKFMKESGYSKRLYFIRKDISIPSKIDLYDKKDVLSKTLSVDDIKEVLKGKYRGHHAVMFDHKTGHKTELTFKYIKINTGIDVEYFTTRYLEKL